MTAVFFILGLMLSWASFAAGPCAQSLSARAHDVRPQTQIATPLQIPARHVARGTESGGGGGGVVLVNGRPVMLDFFQVMDLAAVTAQLAPPFQPAAKPCSLRLEDGVADYPAFEAVFDILTQWEARPFDTISTIVKTTFGGTLLWNFTEATLPTPLFHQPANLPDLGILTAAYYQKTGNQFQVNVNLPIWRQMDLTNQTALLLHEALRQLQLGWGVDFSEEALQQGTAIYLLCRPHSRLSFYLFMVLNNGPELAQQTYGSFDEIMTESCGRRL